MELIRSHVFVSGQVQGVGYRFSTHKIADRLGLKGWVRNLPDGRVEAVFEGEKQNVETMLKWCETGPRMAIVQHLEVLSEPPEHLQSFQIKR
ncbi:acylphosphatase [Phormidesmis priestleyi]